MRNVLLLDLCAPPNKWPLDHLWVTRTAKNFISDDVLICLTQVTEIKRSCAGLLGIITLGNKKKSWGKCRVNHYPLWPNRPR